MDGASLQFVLFGLAVALISNFNRSRLWRSGILLLASLIFLFLLAPGPKALIPLCGFLALGYGALALTERGYTKGVTPFVVTVILAYVWLKKYAFLPEMSFLKFPYLTLGLSYIFFRVLQLLISAGEREEKKLTSVGEYLLYTLNFTTLISGPIQQYDEFAGDLFTDHPIELSPQVVVTQIERIVRGFFKVNVLAMLLDAAQQDALQQLSSTAFPLAVKVPAAFRLSLAYPLFLYCNFSGYIDIVIALARLARIRLPENFDRPFSASSFIDFWNRWHITLSVWLKTYVYNPLLMALSRRIPAVRMQSFLGVLCFFVTFFLIGVWHGRTSEFVVFGFLQGAGVAVNKLWQNWLTARIGRKRYKAFANRATYVALGRGLTFSWFSFTLYWFWASWPQIGRIFSALSAPEWIAVWLAVLLTSTVVLAGWEKLREWLLTIRTEGGPVLTSRYAGVVYASVFGFVAFIVTVLLNQPAPGIVYKAF